MSKDGMAVLTYSAWAAIVTSAHGFPTTFNNDGTLQHHASLLLTILQYFRMKHTILALLTLITSTITTSFAQGKEWLPLSISIFNESTAVPYTRFLPQPLHPGIQIGLSRQWNKHTQHYLYQTLNISYFYHRYLYQATTLSTEIGYDYRFSFGLHLKALIGIGYMLTMNTQEVYAFQHGEFHRTTNSLMSKLQATFSIGAGYRIFKDRISSPELFFLYQSGVIYPFSADFIPIMSQVNVHLGVKIPLRIKK